MGCKISTLIRKVKSKDDSIGGSVTCMCTRVPPALGEPVFDRLEAQLAHAMLSLPATKGFEIGSGFKGTEMTGSQHNDPFKKAAAEEDAQTRITQATNYAGGTLGGISSGTNIMFHVAVKAVATIGQAQPTVTYDGEETVLEAKGRHDPCVLPRTPPLVEGMTALVLIDAALMQRTRLGGSSTVLCDGQNQDLCMRRSLRNVLEKLVPFNEESISGELRVQWSCRLYPFASVDAI